MTGAGPEPDVPTQAALIARIERLEAQVAELTTGQSKTGSKRPDSESLAVSPGAAESTRPAAAHLQTVSKPPTSLESELGTKVLNKIAVLLLLVGVAWFLKWAFDNQWIGPLGRIVAGLFAGMAVILWSERFRRQDVLAFSYALKAVGSGVLYLSLWAGFQVYHLVPAPVALLAMMLVTIAIGVLAVTEDAELLAGLALLGGYLTPLLLSTRGNHETFLFSYVFVLAVTTVALLHYKPWSRLLLGVFPAVVAYFVSWYATHFVAAAATRTLLFALLLWVVFAVVPFVARERDGIIAAVATPLSASAFVALSVYVILADSGARSWEPWWAVGFAAVYVAMARMQRNGVAAATHLSLAIVFLAAAIALKATGRAVSIGWLVEAIALLWFAPRAQRDEDASTNRAGAVFRWLACALLALGTVGALAGPSMDGNKGSAFLNQNFVLVLGDVLALSAVIFFARRFPKASGLSGSKVAAVSFVLLNVVLLVGMHREIVRFFENGIAQPATRAANERVDFAFSAWMMLQGTLLMVLGFLRRIALSRWVGLLLLAATVIKAFAYDMRSLGTGYRIVSYLVLGMLLMGISYAYQKDWLGLRMAPDEGAL